MLPDPKAKKDEATRKWFLESMEKESLSKEKSVASRIFDDIITNQEIKKVSRDLFMDGYYRNAVLDAMVQLECMVKKQAKFPKDGQNKEMSGSSLMREVFNPNHPIIKWSNLEDQPEKDEFEGYSHIFAGAMQGIRNPKAHMIFGQRPLRALQLLTLASLLADLVQASKFVGEDK